MNLSTDQSISVSKELFENSALIADTLWEETECQLPDEYYDEDIITVLDNLMRTSKLPCNDLLILTKVLLLMDFLRIKLHIYYVVNKVSRLLCTTDDDDLESNIDEKFAGNYALVAILWCETKNKKIFFKLPKLSYANLELDLSTNEDITQDDLDNAHQNLKDGIIKINAYTPNITNVDMFTKLEELDAKANSGIGQDAILRLTNLRKLNAHDNRKITDVNHLTNLEELDARGGPSVEYGCGIDQDGIRQLTNLRKLYVANNKKIKDVNHLTGLEELDARYECGIDQDGIRHLTNLRKLYVSGNTEITDVHMFTKLEELSVAHGCGIGQNEIHQLTNLRKLNADGNEKIHDVNHMAQLEVLDATNCCGIDQYGIRQLTNLRILYAHDNNRIKNVNHMKQLEILDVHGDYCTIDQMGIHQLSNLCILNATDNDDIPHIDIINKERYAERIRQLLEEHTFFRD
jgi:Leucine-rich repeat (LRR) protein